MLDIVDFISERGGDPEKVRESQRKRGEPVEIVQEIIDLYASHRKLAYDATQIGAEGNAVQKEIGQRKKKGEGIEDLLQKKTEIAERRAAQDARAAEEYKVLNGKLKTVGNYVHESVAVSKTEDDNKVVRTHVPEAIDFGEYEKPEKLLSHHQVLTRLGGYDPERGSKLVGHRGYCLTGYGVFLCVAMDSIPNSNHQGHNVSPFCLSGH
jgi:seryl-tRNA synthetase